MNILGVDYGEKWMGLAWCQEGLDVVLPFGRLETDDWRFKIGALVKEEKIDRIVVGLPLGMDGQENENTKKIREFVKELEGVAGVPIMFVDERFTSQQADRMGGDASRDEKAAMVILQSYLDS